jgi:hypothetical protein
LLPQQVFASQSVKFGTPDKVGTESIKLAGGMVVVLAIVVSPRTDTGALGLNQVLCCCQTIPYSTSFVHHPNGLLFN